MSVGEREFTEGSIDNIAQQGGNKCGTLCEWCRESNGGTCSSTREIIEGLVEEFSGQMVLSETIDVGGAFGSDPAHEIVPPVLATVS